MAYVKGRNLADKILEGQLEIREALRIARQISEGLRAAHKQGVIHRDLSPSNVILSDDRRVRIVDFGVARLADVSRVTEPGTPLGTAHYVSPEQMKGEAVDQRTDLWSLGVILYELLTGKTPFQGEHREAIYYAIALKNPTPMSALRTGIPVELERVVLKCLEKKCTGRYPDAATLINDLSSIQGKLPNNDEPVAPGLLTENPQESTIGRNQGTDSTGNPWGRPFRLLGRPERVMLLKSVGLLQGISAEDLSYIAGIAEETQVAAGSSIFHEGDHGDCLYIILEGSVRIHKGGRELAVLGRLQSLGEMAVLDGAPRSASATALQDTTMIKVDREQFLELMRSNPEIIQRIVRLLLARLRESNDRQQQAG
jgi:serine/threonine protein kinase